MKQSEKFRQANREAVITCFATVAIIIFWWISGFGLANTNVIIYSTPLWVWGGCLGTWIFACAVVYFLISCVFKNFDLKNEEETHHE